MIIVTPAKALRVGSIRARSISFDMWRWEIRDGFDRVVGTAMDEVSAKAECVAKVSELLRIRRNNVIQLEASVSNYSRSSHLQVRVTQHGMPYDYRWIKAAAKRKKTKTPNAYDVLANFWGVTREEAKRRAYEVMFGEKRSATHI